MRTYITLVFNSEGKHPSKIISDLGRIGFKAVHGNYDLVYHWEDGENRTIEDVIQLIDKVHETLTGSNVQYQVVTI